MPKSTARIQSKYHSFAWQKQRFEWFLHND